MDRLTLRPARETDVPALLEIYNYYVRCTAVTFDLEPAEPQDFARKLKTIQAAYPCLVAERDGVILGYAYAGPFVGRAAYALSVETTIYLDPDHRGEGIGRALYTRLERELAEQGILNLYACIGYPETPDEYLTTASAEFHAAMGYRLVGRFRKCGRKFDRWYDMIWMEKFIGDHP